MTAPGGGAGGAGNVGTAFGKVRINYESNSTKAVRDLEHFQSTLAATGAAGTKSVQGVSQATGAISQLTSSIGKMGRVTPPNPVAGMAKQVQKETASAQGAITKAMADYQRQVVKAMNVNAPIRIAPKDVTIDRGAFTKAIEQWKRDGGRELSMTTLTGSIRYNPQVNVDTRSATEAGRRWRQAFDTASQSGSTGGGRGGVFNPGGGSGGAGGAGAAGMLATLGKISVVAATASAAVAGVGYVFTKGFSRLNSIDEATNKLKILGLTAQQIQGVADSALVAVKGTAFGLNEAFSTSADAINAGIKPGAQLNKYLQATANTASLAGVGMQELGSAFSQAATQGKLTGDIAQMLYSRQVPLLKLLADEYNVTQSKAQEMVSNGEVDFGRFINAMSKTGGAAKAMGNTIGGSFNNLKASISRLGANLLAPLFGKENADDATIIAQAIQKVTSVVDSLGNMLKENYGTVVGFWEVIGKAGLVAVKAFFTVIGFITNGIATLVESVSGVSDTVGGVFADIAEVLGKQDLADRIRGVTGNLKEFATQLRANRDFNMGRINNALDKGWDALGRWGDKARAMGAAAKDAGDQTEDSAPKYVNVADALDKLQIKSDGANTALKGTTEQFKEFLKSVKDKGGTDALIAQLQKMHDQYNNGGRQIESYADAVDKMKDSTASAADKADTLLSALKGLGVIPNQDALKEYNEEFDKMTSITSKLIDNLDLTGDQLANVDGTINLNTGNGRAVADEIESIRQKMVALVASGQAGPEEAYNRTVQGANQLLQGQAGISPDVAQKIIDKYIPKDAILNSITAQDPAEAIKGLFKDNPAKIATELNLLTSAQDLLKNMVGPDGQLHIPTVLDTTPDWGATGGIAPTPLPGGLGNNRTDPAGKGGGFIPKHPQPAAPPVNTGPLPGITGPSLSDSAQAALQAAQQQAAQKRLTDLANNQGALDQALAANPEIQQQLQAVVDQANKQGQNMADAFANGILNGSDSVKQALLQLAGLAGDYLGNSPAKYGPLSGKGWTLSRGAVFSKDWAKGISSESGAVEGAVEGVATGASKAVSSLSNSGGNGVTLNDGLTQFLSDMQEFSDFGKSLLDFGKQIGDIAFGGLKFFNDLSGGALFPKSYKPDPNAKKPGSALPGWNPTANPAMQPGLNGTPNGVSAATGGDAASVQRAIVSQAQAMGFSKEQTIAALAVANQETGYGTNPRTNDIQNQNGTAGITGVFQQDMGYRKYGDPRDPNVAIKGFLTEFANRGQGLNNPNPWDQAVNKVQIPANAGNGGYRDADGSYLKNRQRTQAEQVYNSIVSGLPGAAGTPPPVGPITSAVNAVPLADTSRVNKFPQGNLIPGYHWEGSNPVPDKPGTPPPAAVPANRDGAQVVSVPGAPTKYKVAVPGSAPAPPITAPGGLLAGLDTSGKGVNLAGAHGQIALVAAIAKTFGLEMTSGATNHDQDKGFHPRGQAGDFSNGKGNTPQQAAFAKYMADNFGSMLQELIYSDPNAQGVLRGGGKDVSAGGYYSASTLSDHLNHVHIAVTDAMAAQFEAAVSQAAGVDVSGLVANASKGAQGIQPPGTGALTDPLWQIANNTNQLPTMPAQLRDLITQDPELANALSNTGSLTQETVVPVLQKLDTLQAQQNKLAGPDTKSPMADAIGGVKSQLQSNFGLTEGPSALDKAQTIFSGATGIASDVFAAVDAGIKWIGGVQDFTNVMVRGIANTGDVNKLIDDVQTGIDLASKIFQAAGSITSFAGSFTGGTDFGGTAAAGQALSMIGTVISAVNTGIDIGQEAYKIATKYLGRAIQGVLGLSGASDVRYLLDEVTGQVQAYSSDNPQQKTTMNTLGRELGSHRYGERPAPNNNFTIYQGPGQDPRDTMDDAMFTIRASGQGAFGYAV